MGRIRIGTCSWKFESWEGLVYSRSKGINYLQEYARRYDTVEVDQWFWSLFGPEQQRLPNPFDVEEYARSVPEDFRFSVKVPNSITLTHFYRKKKDEPLRANPHFFSPEFYARFLGTLEPLRGKLGLLMFQFEYLNKQKMPSQREFQERLARFAGECDRSVPWGVEVRNPNYLNPAFFGFLASHSLGPVFLQGYYMPPVDGVVERALAAQGLAAGGAGQTEPMAGPAPPAALRLHGPQRQEMEERSAGSWERLLAPRDEELDRMAAVARRLADRGPDLFLNVNNHYEGSAPLTIERLRERLETGPAGL